MSPITTCDSCAPAVVNDDWTHLDAAQDGTEETREAIDTQHASILGALEILGWLSLIGEADEPGYFACEICGETQCSGGYSFEVTR